MMFCRRALQRVGPLAKRILKPASNHAPPVRHMAFGIPGGSSNMTYFVLCGGGLTAAVVYAYKTVNGDSERYEDRLANMGSKTKEEAVVDVPSAEKAAPAADDVEPVSETSAESAAEAAPEEAGVVGSEAAEVVSEAEPAPSEEVAVPQVEEVAAETTPTPAEDPVEVVAAETTAMPAEDPVEEVAAETTETPAEDPAVESVGTAALDEVLPAPPAETETAASA